MADATLHMNLAEVREKIETNKDLALTQKRDLISALNALSKWRQMTLDTIAADRRDIRKAFEEINHSQVGVSKKRFKNVRSSVDKALEIGMTGSFNASKTEVTEEWQALLDLIEEKWRRFKILQLARYCSSVGITPDQVTAETLKEWTVHRQNSASLAKKPERAVQDALSTWNWCAEHIPDWAWLPVAKASKRDPVLLPLDVYPKSLQDELRAFEQASLTGAMKSKGRRSTKQAQAETGRRRRSKKGVTPRVAQKRVTAIRQCAQALIDVNGVQPDSLTSIETIVTPDNAETLADAVIERTGKATEYPHSLVKDLRAVAVQWLGADKAVIAEYNEILASLKEEAGLGGLTPENRKRLLPFRNPKNIARLVSLPGLVLADLEAERKKRGGVTLLMGCRARSAIAISLLTMLPVRRANLVAIEIGTHLTMPFVKTEQAYLNFEVSEVKNKRAIGCTVPREKQNLLEIYLKHYRPALTGRHNNACSYLLPTQSGRNITGVQLSHDVSALIYQETGLRVNLNLFRHLMAALILREKPGHYDTVRALLGHSKDSRVTELYAEIESDVAAEILSQATKAETTRKKQRKHQVRKFRRHDI